MIYPARGDFSHAHNRLLAAKTYRETIARHRTSVYSVTTANAARNVTQTRVEKGLGTDSKLLFVTIHLLPDC